MTYWYIKGFEASNFNISKRHKLESKKTIQMNLVILMLLNTMAWYILGGYTYKLEIWYEICFHLEEYRIVIRNESRNRKYNKEWYLPLVDQLIQWTNKITHSQKDSEFYNNYPGIIDRCKS